MTDRTKYITLEDAAQQLGVKRGTLSYYIKSLKLDLKKFDLDKHKYLKVADVERIKILKEEAAERARKIEEAA